MLFTHVYLIMSLSISLLKNEQISNETGEIMKTLESGSQDRRCVRTRMAIKQILMKLIAEEDVCSITIKEIAEKADINRKTFYSHYKDVNAVLDDIQNDLVDQLSGVLKGCEISRILRDPYPFFQKLTEVINEDFDFYKYLVRSQSASHFWEKIKEALKNRIMDNLHDEMKSGKEFLSFTMEFIVSGILSIYWEWVSSERKTSLAQVSRIAGALALNSLNTVNGGENFSKC